MHQSLRSTTHLELKVSQNPYIGCRSVFITEFAVVSHEGEAPG